MPSPPRWPGHLWHWHGPSDTATVLDLLVGRPAHLGPAPAALRVWVTEGPARRAALRRQLRERWPACEVWVGSAYKPLAAQVAQALLPDWRTRPPRRVHLTYPVLAGEDPERFLLESYPLAGWLRDLGAAFTAEARACGGGADAGYTLEVDGERFPVSVPLRRAHTLTGGAVWRATGRIWLRTAGGEDWHHDFETVPERAWDAYAAWLRAQPWPREAPYFGALHLRARLPLMQERIGYAHEVLDLGEAFAEELYFGTLEFFQARAGEPEGSRTLQPGQIVPLVECVDADTVRLEVGGRPLAPALPLPPVAAPDLTALDRPPTLAEVAGVLATLPGAEVRARSVQGRPVSVVRRAGRVPGVLVTAGQHANEATGVVAAVRAAREVATPLDLSVIPLENPDGYALFGTLCAQEPGQMHHAARYTALGDDLEYRRSGPPHERAARAEALARRPALHLNLHGYPSHEWTRPLSGYVPRGFAAWTLPKGFLLIFRYQPGTEGQARDLAQALCAALGEDSELLAFNARQLAVFGAHSSARPYELLGGVPCVFSERPDPESPLTVITEFPDETVRGPDFLLGVRAQLRVIEAGVRWAEGKI
ncbi:Zinc carboxypeptidase [Deinococcus reticulitermitis]|uniref:Zinc carboxypeptidase n=1 Tax=Deinococcus reticulitermitis TaxID=856736 RepID=A0A1H6UND5_9DEIO|nr:M14 family zinc carboxypeptidase [Deinococcus reticulitermitis]SEI92204.1 Zinc carboxypeptidase [Deinococcus reticulitermitis]